MGRDEGRRRAVTLWCRAQIFLAIARARTQTATTSEATRSRRRARAESRTRVEHVARCPNPCNSAEVQSSSSAIRRIHDDLSTLKLPLKETPAFLFVTRLNVRSGGQAAIENVIRKVSEAAQKIGAPRRSPCRAR